LPTALLTTDVQAAVSEPADLVVEVIGGDEPREVHDALKAGRTVVTANKALDRHANSILRPLQSAIAHRFDTQRPSRCGPDDRAWSGSPLWKGIGESVVGIRAILNATCNFVLELLERGNILSAAIELAEANGFSPKRILHPISPAPMLQPNSSCSLERHTVPPTCPP